MRALIAVDGSDNAEHAFDWYFGNIHKDENEVIIGHVAEQPSIYQPYFGGVVAPFPVNELEEMIRKTKREVHQLMTKFENKLHQMDGKVHHRFVFDVINDATGEALVRLADKEKCDIIITGSRGLGVVRRTILGSVSGYIVHHAHVPVLVCHK
ncbi:universal stress protein Sll1388-like [Ciona intestinalis]